MTIVRQPSDEIKPDYSPDHPWARGVPLAPCAACSTRGPYPWPLCDECQRKFFCCICYYEMGHRNRLPTTDGRALHPRCLGKKPRKVPR